MFGAAGQLSLISMSVISDITISWTTIIIFTIVLPRAVQRLVIIGVRTLPRLSFGPSAKTKAKAATAAYHFGNNLTQHVKLEPWRIYSNYQQPNKYIRRPDYGSRRGLEARISLAIPTDAIQPNERNSSRHWNHSHSEPASWQLQFIKSNKRRPKRHLCHHQQVDLLFRDVESSSWECLGISKPYLPNLSKPKFPPTRMTLANKFQKAPRYKVKLSEWKP